MSEEYVFERAVSGEKPVRSPIDRRFKWLLTALAVLLAGELIWVLGVTPCMPFSVIEISGIPDLDRGEVLARAGIGLHSSYMTVDARGAELALNAMYQVESARVTKQFPDTIRIVLEGRRAAAMTLVPVKGKLEPVLLDKYGVVIQIGSEGAESGINVETLPIISGLVFADIALGMKLPAIFRKFFSDLVQLQDAAPELLGTISEIQVSRKAYDGFELALFPVHYPSKIRVGNEITADTIRYMLLLIDVLKKQGVMPEEIDFRTGTASYKKEASLGQ
ncbi:MAG: FtsQ-type POTRA domain-containing protein [Treponema sp.]|jgi:cell division protein FtsQ|nr:FtsQ-type POTRA domain-containing protein [Treponema sp.]